MTHIVSGAPVRMFRLTKEPGGLGLSCTPDGVSLAGVPLLRKTQTGFEPRPAMEIAALLKTAYGTQMPLQSRLGAIAQALSRGDFATAMIAAVHTETPELSPAAAARLAQADQALTKYNYDPDEPRDWHGRWTKDGSAAPAGVAYDRPVRIAENTFLPSGAISSDTPAPPSRNPFSTPAQSDDSGGRAALLRSFEEKYDDLGPEDFSDQVIRFGYWLEAHGRELTGAERQRALAEYFFLENRIRLRQNNENNSALEHGYLYSAVLMLHRGGAASGLVPVSHFPPSILDVAGTIALLESHLPIGRRPTTRPFPEELPAAAAAARSTAPRLTASARVTQLAEQGLSTIQRERFVTLAITETREGVRIVSSSDGMVRRSVRQLLQEGEVDVSGTGHAEIIGVEGAKALGLNPIGVAASRSICGPCAEYLRNKGIVPLTRLRR
jgi:hypothetical protein